MTPDEIPLDAPILRCANKKAVSVIRKAAFTIADLLATAIAYLLIAGAAIYVQAQIFLVIYPSLVFLYTAITEAYSIITLAIWAFVPLWAQYVIGGVVLIAAIVYGYSLLWCMARNLTGEDWRSEKANAAAFALALALAAAFAIAAFALALAAAFVIAAAFAIAFALALDFADSNCKALLFIGAYLHYRERMKKSKEV